MGFFTPVGLDTCWRECIQMLYIIISPPAMLVLCMVFLVRSVYWWIRAVLAAVACKWRYRRKVWIQNDAGAQQPHRQEIYWEKYRTNRIQKTQYMNSNIYMNTNSKVWWFGEIGSNKQTLNLKIPLIHLCFGFLEKVWNHWRKKTTKKSLNSVRRGFKEERWRCF